MMRKGGYGVVGVALLASAMAAQPAAALTIDLTNLSTLFDQHIGIDYFEPTNNLIVSSWYPSGNPHNFQIIQQSGAHVQHSAVTGLQDEIEVTAARSVAHGGVAGSFAPGTVFANTQADGQILRINPDGTTTTLDLPGANNGPLNGAMHIDRTGLWNGDLIAATNFGQVWRLNSAGILTNIANLGVNLETVLTVANDPARYGALAGKILATDEFSSKLYAIAANGSVQSWTVDMEINEMDLITANENLFAINYAQGRIYGAEASQFANNIGDILVAQEFAGELGLLKWNFSLNRPVIETVLVTSPESTTPTRFLGQWEHLTFAPAGMSEIAAVVPPVAVAEPALNPALLALSALGLLRRRPSRAA